MTIRLWSIPDGRSLKVLEGHNDSVLSIAISADGRILASTGFDNTVRLWSLEPILLSHLPIKEMNSRDFAWIEEMLADARINEKESNMLRFIAALIQWQWRFDIQVQDAPRHIEVGGFDIEIEG